MKKLLHAFRNQTKPNQFYDSVISILESQDISTVKRVNGDTYALGKAAVLIKYFDPECYEEIQLSFGYALGKGFSVVIRNYGEHLIVINHEMLEQFQTYEFILSPDSFLDREYRVRLDTISAKIMTAIYGLNKQGNSS